MVLIFGSCHSWLVDKIKPSRVYRDTVQSLIEADPEIFLRRLLGNLMLALTHSVF